MADAAAGALEAAIADVGLRLVELDKFRAAQGAPVARLRANALALGDRARRLHRAGQLGDVTATELHDETRGILDRLEYTLRTIRAAPTFRAAVVAHRTGDHGALATLLPEIFADLEHVADPPPLFHPVGWLRRNRPRPAADVVADIARLRDAGLVADPTAETPGADPELPAVGLEAEAPLDDPVFLRFAPGTLPPAVFRMVPTGACLVHVARLDAVFEVMLPATLDEPAEIAFDHPHYRRVLVEELIRCGLPIGGS